MKKIINALLIIFSVFLLASCTEPIEAPQDLKVENDLIAFTEIEDAIYKAVFISTADNKVHNRVVSNGTNIYTLSLAEGEYQLYIEITIGKQVVNTNQITIVIRDINAVNELKGETMLDSTQIKFIGRTLYDQVDEVNMMHHSGSGFEVKIIGTSLSADLIGTNTTQQAKKPFLAVVVDENHDDVRVLSLDEKHNNKLVLVEGLKYGEHTIRVIKRSEALDSFFGVKAVYTDGKFLDVEYKDRFIEILGDSTTAGYGNETKQIFINGIPVKDEWGYNKYEDKTSGNSNALKTFGYLTAQAVNADYSIFSASGWGLTGSIWTNPQTVNLFDAYRKVYATTNNSFVNVYSDEDYNFATARKADAVIISVGTNDLYYIEAMQGDQIKFQERKQAFIDKYKELVDFIMYLYGADTQIFMVYGAMVESRMYHTVEAAYANLSGYTNVHLVKLQGDNGAVDHHPSVSSNEEMAQVLIAKVKEVMNW